MIMIVTFTDGYYQALFVQNTHVHSIVYITKHCLKKEEIDVHAGSPAGSVI